VAELEATAARKGHRKVELTIAGTVSHGLLHWDDEESSDTYIVGDDNDGTSFEFTGEAEKIGGSDWSAGFVLEIGVLAAQSSEVSQIDDIATQALEINESHIWIRHERLGQISWGQVGGSARVDDATEMDLSESKVASFSGVEDIGGGFFLRRANGSGLDGLTSVSWGDLIDHLPGVDGKVVRYDTPLIAGVTGWAEWGEDDVWEVVLSHDSEPETNGGNGDDNGKGENGANGGKVTPAGPFKDLRLAAAVSYHGMTGDPDLPDNRAVSGSVSLLHKPTGLNLTLAAGHREFTEAVELNDGTAGRPQDATFYYLKAGLLLDIAAAGKSAFYTEYGKWRDFLGRDADAEAVGGLAGIDEGDVCNPGEACLVSGSEATIWGFGVVQHIDNADMQIFLGYRHYEADVDLADVSGGGTSSPLLTDFDTIIAGTVIEF